MATAAQIKVQLDSKQAEENASKLSTSLLGSLTPVVDVGALAGKALSVVGSLIGSLVDFAKEAVASASEAEQAELRLVSALEARGIAAGKLVGELREFNAAEQQRLGISGDTLVDLQAQLVAQGVHAARLKEATAATVGLAEATGKDLMGTSKDIAKLFAGELSPAIRRVAGDVKSTDEALSELGKQTKLAEDRTQTLMGQVGLLSENYGDLQEALGAAVTQSEAAAIAVQGMNKVMLQLQNFFSGPEGKQAVHDFFITIAETARLATYPVAGLALLAGAFGSDTAFAFTDQMLRMQRSLRDTVAEMRRSAEEAKKLTHDPALIDPSHPDSRDANKPLDKAGAAARAKAQAEFEGVWRNLEAEALKRLQAHREQQAKRDKDVRTQLEDSKAQFEREHSAELHRQYEERLHADQEAVEERNRLRFEESAALYDAKREEIQTLEDWRSERERINASELLNAQQKKERLQALGTEEVQNERDKQRQKSVLAQVAIQGITSTASALGSAIAAAATGQEGVAERLAGSMIQTMGQLVIQLGQAAIAAGILGTAVPFLAGVTGGPGAIIAGTAAVIAGSAIVGLGAVLGGSGGTAPAVSSGAGGGGFRASSSSGDFNRAPSSPIFGAQGQQSPTFIIQGGWFLSDRQAERALVDAWDRGRSGRLAA